MACDVVEIAGKIPGLQCPDPRAWGEIILMAKRSCVIERAGFAYTRKGKAHASPKAVWRLAKR
jgi:hypothetical protein